MCYHTVKMKLIGKTRRRFRLTVANRGLTFTPLGGWFLAVAFALGVAAINSGSNLLYLVVSMMLSLVIVSGIISEQCLKGLKATRMLPDEIYAKTPFNVRIMLSTRKKRIPSFALSISLYYPHKKIGTAAAFVTRLLPGNSAVCSVEETVEKRGPWAVDGVAVSTAFPFGLFRKTIYLPLKETRVVYPHVAPTGYELPEQVAPDRGDFSLHKRGISPEIRNIREYQPQDEARIIHWKGSARTSVLMAKEFEVERKDAVCIVFDNLAGSDGTASMEGFEEAVAVAASLTHRFIHELERPVSFATRGLTIPAARGHRQFLYIMEILAAVGQVSGPEAGDITPGEGLRVTVDTKGVISPGVSV